MLKRAHIVVKRALVVVGLLLVGGVLFMTFGEVDHKRFVGFVLWVLDFLLG